LQSRWPANTNCANINVEAKQNKNETIKGGESQSKHNSSNVKHKM